MTLSQMKNGYAVIPYNKWNKAYYNTKVEESKIFSNVEEAKCEAKTLSASSSLYSVYSADVRKIIF